jgi:hypothetical protein
MASPWSIVTLQAFDQMSSDDLLCGEGTARPVEAGAGMCGRTDVEHVADRCSVVAEARRGRSARTGRGRATE